MNGFLDDLRYALRSFAKSPGFAIIAVTTLALGIGANTAIFSVVHAVLFKPLGFPHPDRLVTLEERGSDGKPSLTGFQTYQDWRARAKSFDDVAVLSYWVPTLAPEGGSEAEKLEGMRVSDGFFRMLGVRPMIGRDFQAGENRPNANRVAMLGYGLWKRRFGGAIRISRAGRSRWATAPTSWPESYRPISSPCSRRSRGARRRSGRRSATTRRFRRLAGIAAT